MRNAVYGLLNDIVRNPDDDGLRLIMADWLEDHDAEPRANIIRQMIADPDSFDADSLSSLALSPKTARSFPVLRAYEWLELFADAEVEAQYGLPSEPDGGNYVWNRKHVGLMGWLHWRRGFVGAVTLPWVRFRYAATRLFRTFPLEAVYLSYLHPEAVERATNDDGPPTWCFWVWHRSDGSADSGWPDADESSYLTPELFDLLPPPEGDGPSLRWAGVTAPYSTQAAAREALNYAALALGRKWRDDPNKSGELS